jgi:hypothetical protein
MIYLLMAPTGFQINLAFLTHLHKNQKVNRLKNHQRFDYLIMKKLPLIMALFREIIQGNRI